MKTKDLIVGIVILAILGVVIYFWQTNKRELQVPEPTTNPLVQEEIEERFNVVLPEDAEKIQLNDAKGEDATAIATRSFTDENFTLTILASLPVPKEGSYYQGWIVRGEEGESDYAVLTLGRLSVAKGGYVLEFEASKDYSNYDKVVVSEELVPDKEIEEIVLEGSF